MSRERWQVKTGLIEVLQAVVTLAWFLSIPAVIVSWTTKLGMATLGPLHPTILTVVQHPWCCLSACILSTRMMYELFWTRESMAWMQRRYQDAPMITIHVLTYTTALVLIDALSILGAHRVVCEGDRCTLHDVLSVLYRVQPMIILSLLLVYKRWLPSVINVLVELNVLHPHSGMRYSCTRNQ